MKILVSFQRVSALEELRALRNEYLDALVLAQEPSIEVLMPDAAHFIIIHDGVTCGYFSTHEHTLIEFYVQKPYWVFGECVLDQIIDQNDVKLALVKSFDHLLFSSCVARHKSLRVKGLLVRDIIPRDLPDTGSMQPSARLATLEDLPAILAVDQQVFRHPERLQRVLSMGFVHLFLLEDEVIGFGIARPVIPGRKDVELGIAVDKPYRSQGHSVALFRAMMDSCIARGLTPVAGVAVENIASRSMGERAGMHANHRLLELTF